MLPFLKENKEGAASQPVTTKSVTDREYDLLDAVAEDMLAAFKAGDSGRLRDALTSFCEYIQDQDHEQDEQTMGDETT